MTKHRGNTVLFIFHPGRCKKAISNLMQPGIKAYRKEGKNNDFSRTFEGKGA